MTFHDTSGLSLRTGLPQSLREIRVRMTVKEAADRADAAVAERAPAGRKDDP